MSNIISQAGQMAKEALTSAPNSKKIEDLKQEFKECGKDARLTTDYGVKQTSADDWLKIVSDDKTGPALLEDPFARERVSHIPPVTPTLQKTPTNTSRSCASTTRESLSE